MKDESLRARGARQVIWVIAIIVLSTIVGIGVVWRIPRLDSVARDWLMRLRGPLSPPAEVVIVAIDEPSVLRFGRFPWPRALMAQMLDKLALTESKVIGLNVLYSEPTAAMDDRELAKAIARAGNVVTAAQLIEATDAEGSGRIVWLRPLPEIERASAGVGHVNVFTGFDGIARSLVLRQADNEAQALWAMAIELARIGDRASGGGTYETPDGVRVGSRLIPLSAGYRNVVIAAESEHARTDLVRASHLSLDYVGPPGSFAAQTYSFADVFDGRVAAEKFRGKYVLIGATATALGDRVASPFIRAENEDGRPRAELMPGVEVLANALHTVLRGRFYRETPDGIAVLLVALVATAVTFLLAFGQSAQGRWELIKQLAALTGLAVFILLAAYLAFTRWLIAPPLAPALISFVTAAPLTLFRRSFVLSANLDTRIAELEQAGVSLMPSIRALLEQSRWSDPAARIAEWTDAVAVAILARRSDQAGDYLSVAHHGAEVTEEALRNLDDRLAPPRSIAQAKEEAEAAFRYFSSGNGKPMDMRALVIRLGESPRPAGALIIAVTGARQLEDDILLLCREVATGYLASVARPETESVRRRRWWPRGIEWKTRALGILHRRLLARSGFVERALHSIEDGLLITSTTGRIAFANPRAAAIFNTSEEALVGSDLLQRIRAARRESAAGRDSDPDSEGALPGILFRPIVERAPVELAVTLGDSPKRHYVLRLSAVSDRADGTYVLLGLVATLSDVTKQYELQQMKNDVMALVSHELRTPLTAIQAMSEVLAKFDFDPERRYEMHAVINDETKRLARMIDEYLDITRLESGARLLQPAPARIESLLERALLLLDPVAAQRRIRLTKRFASNLPAVVADGDLLARAITNLVANAIKFSSAESEVTVAVRAEDDAVWIEVSDRGCGIPPESLPRIFEKFYRVPRVDEGETPGAGLGLAFVREIVELHGGRVTAQSEVGVGSVFSLRLPLNHSHA